MRLGFFELSVSQVSIVLEIIAAIGTKPFTACSETESIRALPENFYLARFITFLDPIYSRGFLPLLLTSICRQLAVCMTRALNAPCMKVSSTNLFHVLSDDESPDRSILARDNPKVCGPCCVTVAA
jgi:hypothetical protein